ncbi:MAG: 2-C-methyl-D-erythritol 2,4-cyclodiphosphate synthase [Clostridia bacterium]|nr:2-C-methyl-D-erythritol 2,4-cyclodiphosphate synthase [Clostridia bacterium]
MSARGTAILLAAGSSLRMGFQKLTIPLCGRTALEYALLAFIRADIRDILIAVSSDTRQEAERLAGLYAMDGVHIRLVEGGDNRGDSVYRALVQAEGDVVAIHDAARCLVSPRVILDSIAGAMEHGSGVASLPLRDTVYLDEGPLPRDRLLATQTPQSFSRPRILEAYESARKAAVSATDDAAIYRLRWKEVHFTSGSPRNQKLTTPEDVPIFEALLGAHRLRSGYGEDTHRLASGRALVLGGVVIPFELGLLGHSDADVLTHAVIDAMLGAAAQGDIGSHFPDADPRYRGICSLNLLGQVRNLLCHKGYFLANLDVTVVAQQPKLAPHILPMRKNLARILGCEISRVSIKATTPEGCGPEGALLCITARCVCSLEEYAQ